jgi:hypothetical protein
MRQWTFRREARWMVVIYILLPLLLLVWGVLVPLLRRWLG